MKTLIISYLVDDQRQWDKHLSKLACALRISKHEATRETPYLINFGHEMIVDGRQLARNRGRDNVKFSDAGHDLQCYDMQK